MSRFIKFTNSLINTKYVRKISWENQMYRVYYHEGVFGLNILTIGFIDEFTKEIKICKTKDPIDYAIMKKWIDKQDN